MDFRGLSLKMKCLIKEGDLLKHKKDGALKYGQAILLAKMWFFEAEMFVESSSSRIGSKSMRDFIRGVCKRSGFLIESFSTQLKDKTEIKMLELVQQVSVQLESRCLSYESEEIVGKKVRDLLYKFLVNTILLNAEMLLSELLKNEIRLQPPLKTRIGSLREGLIFLLKSEINQLLTEEEDSEDKKLILAEMEGLAVGVISLWNSYSADIVTEEAKNVMLSQLPDFLLKVECVKEKLKDIYLKIPKSYFPKTPGMRTIYTLLNKLKQLPIHSHDSFECAAYQIEAIHGDLELIVSQYSHMFAKERVGHNICSPLVDAVHHVQHVIDLMELSSDPSSEQLMWLYYMSQRIRYVKDFLPVISSYEMLNSDIDAIEQKDMYSMVFSYAKQVMTDRLMRGTKLLEVVSITGMAGIGKTTLVRNLYNSPIIRNHFHVCVWCVVSQKYDKQELLHSMFRELNEVGDDLIMMSDEDLLVKLYRVLKGKRYLIVMDDVWSIGVWNDLQRSFPEETNGSRVLMTSRLEDVVPKETNGSRVLMTSRLEDVVPNPHTLVGLSNEESWDLLMKIFGHERCPEELLKIGRQTAKSFKDILITIDALGDPGSKNNGRRQKIAESAGSQITQVMSILELSYQYLSDQLKECFLYLGEFPKDKDISVRSLLWLWIAEGFIEIEGSKSLEDVAEDYLMKLIENGLIKADKRGANGKVKTCLVHDLVLDFCLLKARDTEFSHQISSTSHDGHFEYSNPADGYRFSLCGDPEPFLAVRPSGPFVRSLLFFAPHEMYPGCHRDVSFICDNYKLLKVLNLESLNVGNTLDNGIDLPLHLKYLAVGGDMDSLPSSLYKLQNLETLVVKGLMNKFVLLDAIWSMKKLRHIHVSNHCIFILQNDKTGSNSKLDSLVSLSTPSFPFGEQMNDILMRLPNLQKLKCVVLEPPYGSSPVCLFPDMESLRFLTSLKLSYSGRPLNAVNLNLPLSIKELTLSNFRLPWDQISALGKLPALEVLKLISRAFEGSTWELVEGEFLRLRYLKLDSLNIVFWSAAAEDDCPMPFLEQLVLRNCKQLEDVPSTFSELPTLNRVEVHQCGISAENSVRLIVEQQRQYGNKDLNIKFV